MSDNSIVAIGLLTRRDLERLGDSFSAAIPVPADCAFGDLLAQLDTIGVERLGRGVLLRSDHEKRPDMGEGRD